MAARSPARLPAQRAGWLIRVARRSGREPVPWRRQGQGPGRRRRRRFQARADQDRGPRMAAVPPLRVGRYQARFVRYYAAWRFAARSRTQSMSTSAALSCRSTVRTAAGRSEVDAGPRALREAGSSLAGSAGPRGRACKRLHQDSAMGRTPVASVAWRACEHAQLARARTLISSRTCTGRTGRTAEAPRHRCCTPLPAHLGTEQGQIGAARPAANRGPPGAARSA
jgi:hypothetical protein